MKKIFLITVSILFCITVFGQETKTCLFIGTYEKNKRGICGDYELVQVEIKDYADYNSKRTQFLEDHKKQSPNTRFIDKKESVIAYQYEKKIAGWACNSNVISLKSGKSIEDCYLQLENEQAKYPKDFTTQPKIIFTWQGKGDRVATYNEDFGGLSGKFTAGNTATKSIIVAQLRNNTKDKLACITLQTDDGTVTKEYIHPGNTLSKKYDTQKLDIKVSYLDSKIEPTEEVLTKIKNGVRKLIINEKGTFKTKTVVSTGVRG